MSDETFPSRTKYSQMLNDTEREPDEPLWHNDDCDCLECRTERAVDEISRFKQKYFTDNFHKIILMIKPCLLNVRRCADSLSLNTCFYLATVIM